MTETPETHGGLRTWRRMSLGEAHAASIKPPEGKRFHSLA
jgi:hypothetical protein